MALTLLQGALPPDVAMPEPYYIDPQGQIELYVADSRPWAGRIDPSKVGLCLLDPPYRMQAHVKRGLGNTRKLQRVGGVVEQKYGGRRGRYVGAGMTEPWENVVGDDERDGDMLFDPVPLLRYPRLVLWGANYYAHLLPPSASWIVWDKIDGLESDRVLGFNDNADAELAWTNLGGPPRIIRHRWNGMNKASERGKRRMHATEKPVYLSNKILQAYTKEGDLVVDFYMGSGPVAASCKLLNRRYIGFEIREKDAEQAVIRLRQSVLPIVWETQSIETGGEDE